MPQLARRESKKKSGTAEEARHLPQLSAQTPEKGMKR